MELKPFYPIFSYAPGSYRDRLQTIMMKKLEKDGYEQAITCPEGDNLNQWVAVHMAFFFNDINLLYGAVQETCTNFSCPHMTAGAHYEYLWADKYKYKTPTSVPAKTYIDNLLNWVEHLFTDETLFPQEKDGPFPTKYVDRIRTITKRFFRVYAHIFYSHLDNLRQKGIEKVFYDSLTFFLMFTDNYSLMSPNDLRPLSLLINHLVPGLRLTQLLNQQENEPKRSEMKTVSHVDSQSTDSTEVGSSSLSNRENRRNETPTTTGESSIHAFAVPMATPGEIGKDTLIDTNLSTQGVTAIVTGEETVNWEAVMKESEQAKSLPENTEGEENCECSVV